MCPAGPRRISVLIRGLSTSEYLSLIDDIARFAEAVHLSHRGEPFCADIFDLAAYGTQKGLLMVMATNGTLVTRRRAQNDRRRIPRVSISIDGPDAPTHDRFASSRVRCRRARGHEAMKAAVLKSDHTTIRTPVCIR